MATSKAEGSQLSIIDSEITLVTITDPATYVLTVDLSNMAMGDIVVLRAKLKVRGIGTTRTAYIGTYEYSPDDPVAISIPLPTVSECVFTLEQIAGSVMTSPWEVVAI